MGKPGTITLPEDRFIELLVSAGRSLKSEKLKALAAARGASAAQLALAWLMAKSALMLMIPGTGSVAHLEENVAAAGIRLSAAELAALA